MGSDPLKLVRGLAFPLLMTWAAFCVALVVFPSALFIAVPSKRVIQARRTYVSFWCGKYLEYAAYLIEVLCGTQVFVHCDSLSILSETSGVLVMSNHRTRIDWMFVGWCYGAAIKVVSDMLIILKDALRTAPIFGWLMQLGLYVFLERKKDSDIPHITNMLTYLINMRKKPSLLLFPEGTDLSDSNVVKSDQYAKERGLPSYRYVLHPKPTGLVTALDCMRRLEGSALHDITIAYDDYRRGVRPSEKGLLVGEFPSAIYLRVDRYAISSLPSEKKQIEQWLRESFARKENILREFYTAGEKGVPPQSSDSSVGGDAPVSHRAALASLVKDTWPQQVACFPPADTSVLSAVVLIVTLMLGTSVCLWYFSIARWATAAVIIVYVSSKMFNGFDNLELTLHLHQFAGGPATDIPASMVDKKHS